LYGRSYEDNEGAIKMNEVEYHKLYEEDSEVKEYIRKLARSYNTTEDTVLKWAIAKSYMDNKKGKKNG
jgi:hypothetical protein